MRKKKTQLIIDTLHIYLEKNIISNIYFLKSYIFLNKIMALKEIQMIDISKYNRVLCVGSGAVPWTLLLLSNLKNWELVGIDKEAANVELANKLIKYFKKSDKILIKNANGANFDTTNFDLVILSFGVHPRGEILKVIGNRLKDNNAILFRTTWKYLDKIYGEVSIPNTLKIKKVYHRIDGLKTLLLIRNKGKNV